MNKTKESIDCFVTVAKSIELHAKNDTNPIKIDYVQLLANSYEKLGQIYRKNNDLEKSLHYYKEALHISSQILPKKDFSNIKNMTMIGDLLFKLEKFEEAQK